MKNRDKLPRLLLLLPLIVALTGCAGAVSSSPTPIGDIETPPSPSISPLATSQPGSGFESAPLRTLPPGLEPVPPTEGNPVVGEVPEGILDEIIADLLKRTGAARKDIRILRAESVVWDDGSLGCPKPGEFYIQMMINGYWVVLEVRDQEYDYRVSGSGDFILCEGGGNPPVPQTDPGLDNVIPLFGIETGTGITPAGPDTTDPYPERVITAVTEDLSQRLNVNKEEILIITSGYIETQTGAPCGSKTSDNDTGPSAEGIKLVYEVLLKARDEAYRYTAIGGLAYYCGNT